MFCVNKKTNLCLYCKPGNDILKKSKHKEVREMTTKLSKRQQDILLYIKEEVKKKGYPPSVREIGEAVGLASSSTVHGHLSRLESKGLIRRDPTKPRAIEILQTDANETIPTANVVNVPVIGKVTAGQPITAVENIEEYFPLPDRFAAHD